jgi:hypothetical protein
LPTPDSEQSDSDAEVSSGNETDGSVDTLGSIDVAAMVETPKAQPAVSKFVKSTLKKWVARWKTALI